MIRERWIVANGDGTMALGTPLVPNPAVRGAWMPARRMEWMPLADVNGYYPSKADALAACYGRDGARPLRIAEGN